MKHKNTAKKTFDRLKEILGIVQDTKDCEKIQELKEEVQRIIENLLNILYDPLKDYDAMPNKRFAILMERDRPLEIVLDIADELLLEIKRVQGKCTHILPENGKDKKKKQKKKK